jgi:hypothetical protein
MSKPAAPRIDFSDKVAMVGDEAAEQQLGDAAIGKLVFFQLSKDLLIPPDELTAAMTRHGLSLEYLPKPPNPATILKGLIDKARYEIPIEDRRYRGQFLHHEIEGGGIVANLVRLRDADAKAADGIEMVKVAAIGWDPEHGTAIASRVAQEYAEEFPYAELLNGVAEEFALRATHYSNTQVGSIVSKILNETASIPTRPKGGVWLVPKEHIELLGRVEAFINELDEKFTGEEGGETEFNSVILADGRHNRLYISGRVEQQVAREIAAVVDGLAALTSSGVAPTENALAKAAEARRDAIALRAHYEGAIEGEMATVSDLLARFDAEWAALTLPKAG